MGALSETSLPLGAGGVPGLGELYLLLFGLGTAAAVIPAVSCYRGGRGRTPVIWRPAIYVLAVLAGAPAGAAGAYATMAGLDRILQLGLDKSFLTVTLTALPGLFIGGGLVPFGIARLLTRANAGRGGTASHR
jgi:hypothetical protein